MKDCNCIVIDDSRSFTTSSTMNNFLKRVADKNKLNIKFIHLNPKDEKFVDENGLIVRARIVRELDTQNYLRQSVQLVICDYNLADDVVNGFEIIRILRKELSCKKTVILYSSNIDDVIANIIKGDDSKIVSALIIDLVSSKIAAFCQRNEHLEQEIVKHLLEETDFSTDKYLEEELFKYSTFKFKAVYERFNGLTLGEIATHIAKHSAEGNKFKMELVQQVVAYLIDLKDND